MVPPNLPRMPRPLVRAIKGTPLRLVADSSESGNAPSLIGLHRPPTLCAADGCDNFLHCMSIVYTIFCANARGLPKFPQIFSSRAEFFPRVLWYSLVSRFFGRSVQISFFDGDNVYCILFEKSAVTKMAKVGENVGKSWLCIDILFFKVYNNMRFHISILRKPREG